MKRLDLTRRSLLALAFAAIVAGCGSGSTPMETADSLELFNPRLGPAYSQWLVGPISHLATPEEVEAFQVLPDDAAAEAFVDEFWQRRSGRIPGTLRTMKSVFKERVEKADRLYREGGYVGHRTDRGTIFVLFGEPEETEYENASLDDPTTVEVWRYPKDAPVGLHGRAPETRYRFYDTGELTVLYRGQSKPRLRHPIVDP